MSAATAGLKRLHELHLRLQELQQQLEHGPRQVKARQQILAKKQAEVDTLKAELKQVRVLADQKNLQLKTNESKIADLRVKLNQATSNREFDIIRSQIDADTMANSVLEDEILEVLEKVDQFQQKIAKAEGEANQTAADIRKFAGEVESTAPQLRSKATEIEGSLREAEKILPDSTMAMYRRLVLAHGAGALAYVEGKSCSACNEILSPNYIVELNMGKFIFCRSCGRLLYRPVEGEG
jgi:predicted  nucleic acid-binding Zn-ribbon protein